MADGPTQRIGTHGNQHLPGEAVWLVREERGSGERKFYLSNLPADATLKQFAATIKARWICEQRTQLINAIRGHLAEYGLMAPQGPAHIERLIVQIEDPASDIPPAARVSLAVLVCAFRHLQEQTAALDAEIATRAKAVDTARRLMSVPGIGPLIAIAIEALAPPVETFRSGRDFAAWVGLRPV